MPKFNNFLFSKKNLKQFFVTKLKSMKIKLLCLTLMCSIIGWTQVNMVTTGSYNQNFNSLSNSIIAVTWTDNTTIANWYAQRTGTGTTYVADTGTSNTGSLYSYGDLGNSERALGAVSSGGAAAGNFAHGLLLRNTSGVTITNITVSYTGEQWRRAASAAQTVAFYYKTSSSTISALDPNNNAGWIAVTALDFVSPITGGAASSLDGNNVANQAIKSNIAIPSLNLANNSYIMIKWDDPDHASNDHGMAIDDVTVNWNIPCSITTTWNGGPLWTNGIPTATETAIINANYDTSSGNIEACNLIINSPAVVTVNAAQFLNIQNNLTVNSGATVNILNGGSLVQINDTGINAGNINMSRTANVRLQDYVYWSSPVNNFALASISPTTAAQYLWSWNTTVANANGGLGNWQNASGNMTNGQGYIVRGPAGYSASVAAAYTADFAGVPNNGIYTPTIARGSYTGLDYLGTNGTTITSNDDNWNLVGNPYPSAISINSFLTANTNIDGFVRLWTHGTIPATGVANPFYGSFGYNYSAADYIVLNGTGSTSGPGLSAVIGAGQGFFVLMNPGAATTSTVTFNNAMRDKTFYNAQFYKNATAKTNVADYAAGDRIWLDLISPLQTTRTLIGYVAGATQERDRLYDAITDYKSEQNFYSLIVDNPMMIQGRAWPFMTSDEVPLGIKTPQNGTYTIAIGAVEGVFKSNNQTIYLEDKKLNIIHNLSIAPYTFTETKTIENNRFVLRYTNQTLGNTDFETIQNSVSVFASANEIKINSAIENIKEFEIYDALGRTLASKKGLNNNNEAVNNITKSNQALIVKVTLVNEQVVTKKIVF